MRREVGVQAGYFHGRKEGQRATPISTVVTIVGVSVD